MTPNARPTSSNVAGCSPESPKRSSITIRSRSGSEASASSMSSRRSDVDAVSNGDSAASSGTKSPSDDSSSSPIGFSSETGSCAMRRISRTSAVVISSSSAISSGLGSRPSRCTNCRSMCTTLFSFSTMCTGMRIVRALSAIALVTACRIHQVAYVENL